MHKHQLAYKITSVDGDTVTADPVHDHDLNRAAARDGIVWGSMTFTADPAPTVGTEILITAPAGYMKS